VVKLPIKLTKKVVSIPVKTATKAVKAVGKISGKTWKKIGAVAAVGVGAYFGGPGLLKFASSQGGSAIASVAGSSVTKELVSTAIKTTLSIAQQKALMKKTAKMNEAQILADNELNEIARQIAVAEAAKRAPANQRLGAEILANEGALEIQHQTNKIAGISNDTLIKIGIPAALLIFGIFK
jgi:hypothetical protein